MKLHLRGVGGVCIEATPVNKNIVRHCLLFGGPGPVISLWLPDFPLPCLMSDFVSHSSFEQRLRRFLVKGIFQVDSSSWPRLQVCVSLLFFVVSPCSSFTIFSCSCATHPQPCMTFGGDRQP